MPTLRSELQNVNQKGYLDVSGPEKARFRNLGTVTHSRQFNIWANSHKPASTTIVVILSRAKCDQEGAQIQLRLPHGLTRQLLRANEIKVLQGIGEILLVDALKKALQNSVHVASWAVVVDAKDEEAAEFYRRYGFIPVPNRPNRLFLPMSSIDITHADLLRIAARQRCRGIHTMLQNTFCDPAGRRWVLRATVYERTGSKGFVGYGDADPSNTLSAARGAEMRVAETRAVNRALRKAYGIGLCSVEELGAFFASSKSSPKPSQANGSSGSNGSSNGQPRLRD